MKKSLFDKLLGSAKEIADIEKGKAEPKSLSLVYEDGTKIDLKSLREKLGLTRIQFSEAIGVGIRTVESWEQGRREPSGAARSLLKIAFKKPKVFKDTLVAT